MKKYPELKESAKLLNDYLNDGVKHTIVDIIQKAQEINPNIPAHIIGSDKPDTIAVELYCKVEDKSIRVPFDETSDEISFVEVKNTKLDIVLNPVLDIDEKSLNDIKQEEGQDPEPIKLGFWRRVLEKFKSFFVI